MADPGFSPGGGANSQKCYYFSIFSRKLHENERIWTPRGGARPWRPPLDPPMHTIPRCMWMFLREGLSPFEFSCNRISKIGIFVQLLMQIYWKGPNEFQAKFTFFVMLWIEIEVIDFSANLFSNLNNKKMPTLPTLCITGKLDLERNRASQNRKYLPVKWLSAAIKMG